MAWEVFVREDVSEGHDVPFVSITPDCIHFNAVFSRIAALQPSSFVTVHLDSANLKIGFDFHADQRPNSFLLSKPTGRNRASVRCSCMGLVKRHAWIQSVSRQSTRDKRFTPTKEGSLWVIQPCPAFEERRARESVDIPSDVRGIYRYMRESGEVVYIGRGEIRKRLSQPERQDWEFDRVEYSVVANPDEQIKWEDYWLARFRELNKGRLPIYNKISGCSRIVESEAKNG
jgi:hypothetical protein